MAWTTNEYGDTEPTGIDLQAEVLECLAEHGPLEVGQVAIELGTELRRTHYAVQALRRDGAVVETGRGESRGGQPPVVWGVA
jgi:hypothetical protein